MLVPLESACKSPYSHIPQVVKVDVQPLQLRVALDRLREHNPALGAHLLAGAHCGAVNLKRAEVAVDAQRCTEPPRKLGRPCRDAHVCDLRIIEAEALQD